MDSSSKYKNILSSLMEILLKIVCYEKCSKFTFSSLHIKLIKMFHKKKLQENTDIIFIEVFL